MGTGLPSAEAEKPVLPETVPIRGGRLVLPDVDGSRRTVEIAPFRIGRCPVTNREYAPFVAAGRAAAPPWWSDPDFRSPLQPVVGVTWGKRWLTAAGSRRSREETGACRPSRNGARGQRRARAPKTAWGAVPPGEIPDGPIAGPWEAGRGRQRLRLFDAGTIVHEWCLNRREPDRRFVRHRRARASRGGSAPPDPLVLALREEQSPPRLPLLRFRIPRPPRGRRLSGLTRATMR